MSSNACSLMIMWPPPVLRDYSTGGPRAAGLRDAVFLEPGEHHRPGVFGGIGVVARPIVGVEAMRRVRIDLELARLASRLAHIFALLDVFQRNARVLPAVEGQ